MKIYQNQRRLQLVARTLRLLANAIENAKSAKDLRHVIMSLNSALSIVTLCAFNFQRVLIENAKDDYDTLGGI